MATIEHEALVDLFRRDPVRIASLPLDLDHDGEHGCPRFSLQLDHEVSLELDRHELAERGLDHRSRRVAVPIDLGLGRGIVKPLVFGPSEVPRLDEATAAQHLELALLSVIVHGREESALATAQGALVALALLDEPMRADYAYVIFKSLRRSPRESLRRWIMGKDESKEQYIAKFRPLLGEIAELLETEGEARGRAEGEARGRAGALLRVLAARGFVVSDAHRARIESTTDLGVLDAWLERAVTVASVRDLLGD